jgi:hypothetical protein
MKGQPDRLKRSFELKEWLQSYAEEGTEHKSKYLFCLKQMQDADVFTAAQPRPNPLSVATACACLMQITHIFSRYEGLMEIICETLFRAIYADYEAHEEKLKKGSNTSFEDSLTQFHQLDSFFEQVPLLHYHMKQISEEAAKEHREMRGQLETRTASTAAISLWKKMAKASTDQRDDGQEDEDYFSTVAGILSQARALSSDDKEKFLLQFLMTASGGTTSMLLKILPDTCSRLRHTPDHKYSLGVIRTMCAAWLDPRGGHMELVESWIQDGSLNSSIDVAFDHPSQLDEHAQREQWERKQEAWKIKGGEGREGEVLGKLVSRGAEKGKGEADVNEVYVQSFCDGLAPATRTALLAKLQEEESAAAAEQRGRAVPSDRAARHRQTLRRAGGKVKVGKASTWNDWKRQPHKGWA